MSTSTTGVLLCAYCGRPMLAGVSIGTLMYHQECTRGPGYEAPRYMPLPPAPAPIYSPPGLAEERVREIVREELVRANLVDPKFWAA